MAIFSNTASQFDLLQCVPDRRELPPYRPPSRDQSPPYRPPSLSPRLSPREFQQLQIHRSPLLPHYSPKLQQYQQQLQQQQQQPHSPSVNRYHHHHHHSPLPSRSPTPSFKSSPLPSRQQQYSPARLSQLSISPIPSIVGQENQSPSLRHRITQQSSLPDDTLHSPYTDYAYSSYSCLNFPTSKSENYLLTKPDVVEDLDEPWGTYHPTYRERENSTEWDLQYQKKVESYYHLSPTADDCNSSEEECPIYHAIYSSRLPHSLSADVTETYVKSTTYNRETGSFSRSAATLNSSSEAQNASTKGILKNSKSNNIDNNNGSQSIAIQTEAPPGDGSQYLAPLKSVIRNNSDGGRISPASTVTQVPLAQKLRNSFRSFLPVSSKVFASNGGTKPTTTNCEYKENHPTDQTNDSTQKSSSFINESETLKNAKRVGKVSYAVIKDALIRRFKRDKLMPYTDRDSYSPDAIVKRDNHQITANNNDSSSVATVTMPEIRHPADDESRENHQGTASTKTKQRAVCEWVNNLPQDQASKEQELIKTNSKDDGNSYLETSQRPSVERGPSSEDDLSLGAEARSMTDRKEKELETKATSNYEERKPAEPPPSQSPNARREAMSDKRLSWLKNKRLHGDSFSSEFSLQTSGSYLSSIDVLLDERKGDPEEILMNLGFGAQALADHMAQRIPERFLTPSNLNGISLDSFLHENEELQEYLEHKRSAMRPNSPSDHRFSICSENSIGTHISDLLLGDQPATLPQRFDHCSLPDEYIDKSFNEVFLKRKSDQSCSHEDLVSILNPENQRVLAEQGHYDHYPRLFRENVQKAINNREPVRKYLLAIRRGSTGSFYRLDPNLKSRATFFSSSFDIDSMDLNPHVPIFPLNVDSRFLSRSTNSAMNRLGVSPVRSGSQNLLHPGGHPALSPIAKTHLNDTNIKVRKSSPVGYKVSPIFVPVKNLFDKNKTRNEELTQSSPNTIAEMRKRDWENVLLGNTVQTLNLKVSEDKHEEYSSTDIEVEKFLIIEEGPNTEMEDKENENVVYPEGYWFNPSLSDDGTLIDLHSNTSPVPSDASTIAVNISELSTNTHDEIQAKVEAGIVQADVDELHQKRERFKSSRSSTNSTQLGSEFSSDTGDSDDVDVDEIFHMVHTRNLDYCKNDQEVLCNVFNDRNDVCPIDGEYQYYSRTNSESSDLPPDSSVDVSSCRIDDDSKLDPLSLKLDRTNEPISPLLPNERRELYFKYLEMDTNSHHLDTIDEESLSESSSGVSGYYDLTSAYENEQSVIPDFGLSESLGEMCSSELFNVDDKTSQNSDVISTDSEIVGRGLSKSFSGPADFHSKLTHYKQRSKSVGHQPLMRQKAVSSDEEEDESSLFTGDGLSNDSVTHNLVFDQDEIVDYDSNTVQHDDNFIDTRDLNTESYSNLCNIWNLNKGVGLRVTIEPLIRTKESDELKVSPDLPVCETDINDNNKQMPQFVNNLSLKDVNLVDFFVHKSTAFTENTDISERIVDNEERCMKPVFTSPLHLVSLEPRSMKRANTDSYKTEEHFRDDCSPGTDQISSISVVCSQAGEVVSSERLDTISSDNTNHDFISLINTREMIQAPRTDLTREISENNFATCGKQDSFELEEIQSDRLSPVIHNRRGKLTQSNSLQSDSSGFADSDHGQIENESKAQSETESEQSEDHYFQRSRSSTTESVIYIPNSESSDIKMGNEFSNPDVQVIRDGSQGIYRSTGDMNATVIAWYEDKFGVGTKKDFDFNLSDGSGDTEVTRDDTKLTDEATVDMEIHAPAIPKDNQAVASDTTRKRKITDDFSAWYEDKFGTKPKTKDSEKEQEAFMKEEIIAWYEERFGVGSKKMEKVSKKTRDSSNTKEEAGFLESMFPWKFSRSLSTDSNERGNKEIPKMAHDNPLSESDLRKIKIYRTSGDHLGQSHAENSDDELHQTDIKQPPVLTLSVEDRDTNCIRYDLTQPEKVNGNMTAEKSELLLDDDIIKPERAEVNNLSPLSADVNALSESSRDASFSRFRENGDDVDGGKLLNIINSSTDDEINEEISDEEAYVKFYIGSRQSSVCVVQPSEPIAADKELNAGTISKIDHKNDENELQQMVENVNVNLGVLRELEHGSVDQKDNDWKQAAVQSFAALMSDSEESDDEDDGISVSQSNNNNFEYKDIESENDDSSLICEGTTSVTETAPTFIMKDDDGSGCLNTNLEILNPDKPIKRMDLGFIPSGIVQKARKVFMGNLKSMRKPIEAGNGSKLEVQTIPDYTPQNMRKDRGRTSYNSTPELMKYRNPSDIAEPEITAEKSRYGIPEKWTPKDEETVKNNLENAANILSSELTDFPTKLEPSTDYSELPPVDEEKILPKYRIRNQFADYLLESLEKKKSRADEPKLSEGIIKKLKSIVHKKIPIDDEILSETVDEVNSSPDEKLNQSEEEHEDYDSAIEPTRYSNLLDIAEPEITAEKSRYGIPEKRISKDNETLRNDFENAANILSSELTDFPTKLEPSTDYSDLTPVDEVKILPKYRIRNQFAGYLLESLEKKKSRTDEPKLSKGIIKKLKSIVHKKIPIDDEILSETVDEVNLSPEEKLNQSEDEHEDYDPAIEPIRYSNPSDIAEPEITAEKSRYGIPEKRISKDNETLRNDFENAANILSSELTDFPSKLEPTADYSELPPVDEVKILPKYRIRNQFAGYLLQSLEKKSRTDEPKLSKGIIKKLKSIVHKKIPVDDEIVSKTVHEVNLSPEEKLNQSEEEHEDYDPAIEPIRYSNPSDIAEPEITVEISRYGIPEKRISKDKETVKNNLENATKILSSELTDYPSKLEPSTDYSDLTPVDEEMILPKYRIRNQFAGYLLEGMEKKKSRTDEPKLSKGIIKKLKSIVHKKIPVDDEIVSKTVHEVNSSPEEKLNQSEEEHEDYDPAIEPIRYSNPSDIAEPEITAEKSRYGIPEKRISKDNETLRNDFENAANILSSELTDYPSKLEPSTDYSELPLVDEVKILPKYRIRNQFAGYLLQSLEKKSRTDEPKLSKGIIKKLKSIVHKKIPVDDEIVSKTVHEVNSSPEEKLNQSEEEHEDYDPAIEPIRYSNPSDIAEPEITVEISRYGIPEKRISKDKETVKNNLENATKILSSELTDYPSKLEPSTDYSELPLVDEETILPKYRIRNQFAGYLLESMEKKKSRTDEPKLSKGIIKKLKSIVRKKIPVDDERLSETVDEVNSSPEEKLNQSEEEHEDYDPAIEAIRYSNPSDIAEPEIAAEKSRYGIPEKRTSKDEETLRNNLENAANILSSELTDFPSKLEPSTDYSELPPVDEEKILPKYRIRNQFAGYLLESLEKKKSREESQLSEGIMNKLKSIVRKKILVDDEILSETVGVNLSPEENDCEEKISENDYAIEQITLANINDDTDLTKNHSSSSQTLVPTGDMDFKVVPGKPVSDHTSNEKNEENIREMKPKPDFIDRLLLKLRDEKSDTKPPEIEKPGLFDKFKAMVQKTFGDDDKQITEGKDKQQSSVNAVSNQVTDDMPSEGNIVEEQISISNVTAVNTSNSWINQADVHQTPRVDRNQYQASAKILVDDVIPVTTSSPYLTQDLEKPNERIQTPHHLSPIIPRIAKTLKFEKYRNTPEDSSYLCIQTDPKERSLPVMKLQTLEVELPNDWKGDECGSVISESDFIPAANDENTEEAVLYKTNVDLVIESDGIISPAKMSENREIGTQTDEFLSPLTGFGYQNWSPDSFTCGEKVFSFTVPQFNYSSIYNGSREETSSYKRSYVDLKVVPGPDGSSFVMLDDNQQKNPELDHYKDAYITLKKLCRTNNDSLTDSDTEKPFATSKNNQLVEDKKTRVYKDLDLLIHCVRKYKSDLLQTEKEASACYEKQIDIMCDQDLEELSQIRDIREQIRQQADQLEVELLQKKGRISEGRFYSLEDEIVNNLYLLNKLSELLKEQTHHREAVHDLQRRGSISMLSRIQ